MLPSATFPEFMTSLARPVVVPAKLATMSLAMPDHLLRLATLVLPVVVVVAIEAVVDAAAALAAALSCSSLALMRLTAYKYYPPIYSKQLLTR